MANSVRSVHELVSVASAVAKEVTVHLTIEAIYNATQQPIALSHRYVAADTTMAADGRRHAQIPLARVMAAQRAIGKHTCGADLHQIACELAFEHSIFVAPKENAIGYAEGIQIVA